MRICLYTETALPKMGGQEIVVDAHARHFQELGHEVVVLAPHPRLPLRARDRELPYPVVRHPRFFSTRRFVSWYRWFLLRLHRSFRPDVLHCHSLYPTGYLAALCRGRLNLPVVITSHGGDVVEGNARTVKPVLLRRHVEGLEGADALVAISRFTRDGFRRMSSKDLRIIDIPNGVDLAPLAAPAPRPEGLDAEIRPKEYVLFLGRHKRRKGVDILLDALALTPADGRVQLVVAGDGEERPALEAQAARLGIAGRVRFTGKVVGDAKNYLLQNALCTVMPSRWWEGQGIVAVESFAAGAPVIAAKTPGLEDLIEPNRTGLLVPQDAPAELARAIQTILSDRAYAGKMGENARRESARYSWRNIAGRHIDLYEALRAERACRKAG